MSAYVIVSYDVIDLKVWQEYVAQVMPLLQKHGAEVLVADSDGKTLEGTAKTTHIVIRFASEKAALDFYHDPAYAPIRKLRFQSTRNGNLAVTKAFTPPNA